MMNLVELFLPRLRNSRRNLPVIEVHLAPTGGSQTFVEPNPDYRAIILNRLSQEIGTATFGINPLGDAIYVYQIEVDAQCRRQGFALAFLCWLYNEYGLSITPVHIVGNAVGFWSSARAFPRQLLVVKDELRTGEMAAEKSRWAHLIPEPEHIRLQRICEASPQWQHERPRIESNSST